MKDTCVLLKILPPRKSQMFIEVVKIGGAENNRRWKCTLRIEFKQTIGLRPVYKKKKNLNKQKWTR